MKSVRYFFLALAATILFSCGPKEEPVIKVKEVKVVPPELTLVEGGRESLSAEVVPSDANYLYVEWMSSDESVATVNKNGTVLGVKEGKATITAVADGVSGTCAVSVVKNLTPVTGIKLSPTELTMGKGYTETITATVEPADAANKAVEWSSTDVNVATVADGQVTATGAGQCEIVAKTVDGGFEARCSVSVRDVPLEKMVFANGSEYAIIVERGSTYNLIITFTPANTSDRNIKWTSGDEQLATTEVVGDGQAVVTFSTENTGAVTITATAAASGISVSQRFFVKGDQDPVLAPEGTVFAGRKAHWRFNTEAYTNVKNVVWKSENRSYEGAEAYIAPESGGETTVNVTASIGGKNVSFSLTVPVEEWFVNETIPDANPRNTYPVFNKETTRAYFITRGKRRLYELDLEQGKLGWMFDMNDGKNDNGGDICVNPVTGDIYCSNQQHLFCVSPDGSKKWEILVPKGTTPTSIAGCGPGMSNDCTVVFIPVVDNRFIAVDAASGDILDSFDIPTNHLQFAVYGNNDIVIHTTVAKGEGAIRFVNFSGGKFGEVKAIDSPSADPTDITSPAVSRDQKTAWFSCAGGMMVVVDLATKSLKGSARLAGGYLQGPALTADGNLMFFAAQTKAEVIMINPATITDNPSPMVPYSNGNGNWLNFTTVAVDTQNNVYFFIKDDCFAKSVFYRLTASDGRWTPVPVASIDKQNDDPQGFFNFGGGYLIGGGGTNTVNRVLVRCIDAQRAAGWSGPGGDVCATKNANLVYGE